jgi:hypothetical protein
MLDEDHDRLAVPVDSRRDHGLAGTGLPSSASQHESEIFIIQHGEQMRNRGRCLLNPKIYLIIDQFFPKIVDYHIRTRSPEQAAREGLERYREMGYQIIGRLPPEQQEENRQALDTAFASSIHQLEEFHAREEGKKQEKAGSDIDSA